MGWDDALDLQNDLRRALRSPEGQSYLDWYARGQIKAIRVQGDDILEAPISPAASRETIRIAVEVMMQGDPMWVDEEVVELVQFAAETFEPEAVYPDDLLVPYAFCLLPSPWVSADTKGRMILFRAISWGIYTNPTNPGDQYVICTLWSHADDDDDYSAAGGPRRVAGCPLVLKHNVAFQYGDDTTMQEPSNHALFKQVQVLWRLAQQTIVTAGHQRVSRPVWRRKSNWRQIKTVQVLTLRRANRPARSEGESVIEWSHRWAVRPHWRNQWYPSQKRHYQIWVDGYIKGPDHLPFVAKQRAVEFIR